MNKPATQILTVPPIGQYWPNQGGVYAGIVRDGDQQWHLILAVTPDSKISAPWGKYGETIKGEFSRHDGRHNMQLILTAEPHNEIVGHLAKLEIEGHNDFYFPSQFENSLLRINAPEHLDDAWHWSSTQYSALSAWFTDFVVGYQGFGLKHGSYAVRAVRRLPIY